MAKIATSSLTLKTCQVFNMNHKQLIIIMLQL